MRIGITGHQRLEEPQGWDWVKAEMSGLLAGLPEPLIGITSLAAGADSLFAELVLQYNGSLEAVIPFTGYEQKFQGHDREKYRQLFDRASRVTVLQQRRSDEESYFEAGKMVVDLAELLCAVWDGEPARGLGGTGDVVGYATQKQKDIIRLDPVKRLVTRSKPPPR